MASDLYSSRRVTQRANIYHADVTSRSDITDLKVYLHKTKQVVSMTFDRLFYFTILCPSPYTLETVFCAITRDLRIIRWNSIPDAFIMLGTRSAMAVLYFGQRANGNALPQMRAASTRTATLFQITIHPKAGN